MVRKIAQEELRRLEKEGATVSREPRVVVSPSLEAAMAGLADVVSAKSNKDVVLAISRLAQAVKTNKVEVDIGPLVEALKAHTEAVINRPSYNFNIMRNSRGSIINVKATVIEAED